MARMKSAKDVTIEGVGTDAAMDGWGIHFMSETSTTAAGLGKNFEVRNLTFMISQKMLLVWKVFRKALL